MAIDYDSDEFKAFQKSASIDKFESSTSDEDKDLALYRAYLKKETSDAKSTGELMGQGPLKGEGLDDLSSRWGIARGDTIGEKLKLFQDDYLNHRADFHHKREER